MKVTDVDLIIDNLMVRSFEKLNELPFDGNEMTHVDGVVDLVGDIISDFGKIMNKL